MAEKKLAVVFTSDTASARKGISELNSALGSTEAQAKKTGGVFQSALGGVALAAGVGFAVNEFEQAEATARKTEAVIKSTGNAAQITAEQQDKMVQSLSNLAAVDDEVVAGGANVLRTFKSIQGQETFEGALSAALDLSAALGTDLQTASMQVGKALEDPLKGITALTRAGVSFSAAQKEQIRNFVEVGDKASAQKMILAELETQFGGQAEAAVTSSARMKVALGNAAEAAGGVLAPGLELAANAAQGLASTLGGLPAPAQQLVVVAALGAVAWSRWGDRISTAAGSALTSWRTLSEGLDGVAATRGISKTQAATEALKSSMSGAVGPGGRLEKAISGISVGAGAAGIAVVGLGAILYAWQDEQSKAARRAEELRAAVASIADEAVRTGATVESVFTTSTLPDSIGVTSGLFKQVGIDIGDLNAALQAGGDEWDRYTQAQIAAAGGMDSAKGLALATTFRDLQAQLEGARVSTDAQRKSLEELGLVIDPVTGETETLTQALDGNTKAQGRAEAQARRVATAFTDMGTAGADAFRGLGDGIDFAEMAAAAYTERALDVFSAQQAYDQSTQQLTAHQREAAEVQAQNAENTRKNAEALRQHAQEVQQAADQVATATEAQAEAQDALAEAYANARPDADAMVEAAKRVADAQQGTVAAAEASRVAQEGLNQALVDGAQYLKDLAEANDDNNRSVARADLAYRQALAAQAELAKKPSDDPFAQEAAALRVAEALDSLDDARKRAAESAAAQAEADKAGVEGTPMVVNAREAIAAAADGEVTANERLQEALKAQAGGQAQAAQQIAEAQGRLGDATKALNDAQANLAATQSAGVELSKNEAIQQTDLGATILANAQAKLTLAEAEAEANGKTLTAAESAAILRAGLDEGRAATGFWSTDLQTLGEKLDYAASSRTVTLATQEALDRARDLGYKVETLPNGHIKVTADTSQADGALDALGMKIGALGSQLTGNLSAVVGIAVGGRASGGDVFAGQTYMVGEQGPEMVTFPADGYVSNATRTRQMLSSGARSFGGAGMAMAAAHGVAPTYVTIEIKGHVLDGRELGRLAAEGLNEYGASQNAPIIATGLVGAR